MKPEKEELFEHFPEVEQVFMTISMMEQNQMERKRLREVEEMFDGHDLQYAAGTTTQYEQ